MATTGVVNGTILAITFDGTKISNQLSCSISFSHDVRTWINKDSAGAEQVGAGKLSWEMSGEANLALDAAEGFEEMFDAYLARAEIALEFTTAITGDIQFAGTGMITKLESSPGTEETTNYSYAFKMGGLPVKSTLA